MPSSSTKTGSRASAAVLRNTSSRGPSSAATGRYQPMSRPSGTATATAMPKPPKERARLARVCWPSWPLPSSSHQAVATSLTGGRKVASTRPRRGAVSQRASRATRAAERTAAARSHRPRARAACRTADGARPVRPVLRPAPGDAALDAGAAPVPVAGASARADAGAVGAAGAESARAVSCPAGASVAGVVTFVVIRWPPPSPVAEHGPPRRGAGSRSRGGSGRTRGWSAGPRPGGRRRGPRRRPERSP
ncbi:hypothetical protein SAVIM40S_05525 [Streptomyces avidinii]